MKQNLLIIGSEGSIGKYLSKYYKKKYNIFKVDVNLNKLSNKNLKRINLSRKKVGNVKFIDKIDLVICLSFNLNFNSISKKKYFYDGVNIINNSLKIIKINNIKKIQYFSSFAVYGNNKNYNNEKNTPKPLTNYGKLKLICENKLIKFSKKNKLQYQIFRIPNVYGPEIKSSIIYKFLKNKANKTPVVLNNKGSSLRNFIHINDLAKLSQKAFKINNSGIFNASAKKNYSILQITKMLKVKYIFAKKGLNEPKRILGNSLKAKKIFKWAAMKDLRSFRKA